MQQGVLLGIHKNAKDIITVLNKFVIRKSIIRIIFLTDR